MSENATPGGAPMPPKLNLKKDDQAGNVINIGGGNREAKKHTARIDLPETPPETPLKKKTSRIPLDQVSAEPGAATGSPVPGVGASKTIRLSSPSSIPTITIAPSKAAASLSMDDAKRQTSRIPLEAAIQEKGGEPDTPKTIRIKRPTVTQTIPSPVESKTPPAAQETPQSAKSVTSRIDLPESESIIEDGQPTQRKTIKIRRAEGGVPVKAAPRSPVVARMEQQAAANAADEIAGASAPHPVFPALAAVAVILLCVLVYVLFTQAFPDWGWSFPGKVNL